MRPILFAIIFFVCDNVAANYQETADCKPSKDGCDLKLVCSILKTKDDRFLELKHSNFMKGILLYNEEEVNEQNITFQQQLIQAVNAGYSNRSCDAMWPECGISAGDLLQSALQILRSGWGTPGHTNSLISAHKMSAPGHGHKMSKRSIAGLPPLITISGDEVACRPCEMIGSFCFIFGIGTFKLCTAVTITALDPAQICNIVATPGRIACFVSTLVCFKQGCGAIRLPRLPSLTFSVNRDYLSKNNL